jgi:hypothetical protein
MVDYFTKWLQVSAMPDQRAATCADKFLRDFVVNMGVPEQLHSDQGKQWESNLWQEMCQLFGIYRTRTTPLHPQSDGQTERANRTLLDVLAKMTRDSPGDWDLRIPYATMAYNSSVHSVTGETPYRLMYGREMRTPMSLFAPPAPDQEQKVEWVERLHEWMHEGYAAVVERTQAQHRAEVPRLAQRQKGYKFAVGSKVWLYDPKPKRGFTPKLDANKWSGPWTVIRQISEIVYTVQKIGTQKKAVVNIDRLCPYLELDDQQFPQYEAVTHEDATGIAPAPHSEPEPDIINNGYLPDTNFDLSEQDNLQLDQELLWPAYSSATLTRRAQRVRRKPARWSNQDYDL